MSSDNIAALDYITTGFPSTLQHLETLKLSNDEYKRTTSPVRLVDFIYLRHLRLELNIFGGWETDALDYAYLLDCAPSLEKLELHMWMQQCGHVPYREEHGELRSLPWHPHTHLKSIHITGFFGHKDQVELALHILRCSTMLEAMKIDCRVTIMPEDNHSVIYKTREYLDGYLVATAFVQAADQNNVVEVLGARKVFFTATDGSERFYFVS
nr:unnamed protein product [Digitaria exilis]